jgi:hypothetical protein
LADVLARIAGTPQSRLVELLPRGMEEAVISCRRAAAWQRAGDHQ